MKHILWLASWYPDKLKPLAGDFIERHAKAASLLNRITVLYVVKDDRNVTDGKFHIEKRMYNENCSATILYYKPYSSIASVERAVAGLRYFIFFAELIREHIHENGKPDLLHVHVAWKSGIAALYSKWKYKIPYVITEHWSVFLENAVPQFSSFSYAARLMLKRIFRNAARVSAVSMELSNALKNQFNIRQPAIIPNVVDTDLFKPGLRDDGIFRFIHVSELTPTKNPQHLFDAVRVLSQKTTKPFELVLYAPSDNQFMELAMALGIEDHIKFMGYVPHEILATEMAKNDCLILYSAYETFGCVIIEANACGLPVIVSDIPVMHEIVGEETGIFVVPDSPEMLAQKMLWMMEHYMEFDREKIAEITKEKFGVATIAEKFDEFYS